MTHYDKLIDSIVEELYLFWQDGSQQYGWDERLAKERAQKILEMVEEFQSTRTKLNQWRASD